jgi:hypothetical protein
MFTTYDPEGLGYSIVGSTDVSSNITAPINTEIKVTGSVIIDLADVKSVEAGSAVRVSQVSGISQVFDSTSQLPDYPKGGYTRSASIVEGTSQVFYLAYLSGRLEWVMFPSSSFDGVSSSDLASNSTADQNFAIAKKQEAIVAAATDATIKMNAAQAFATAADATVLSSANAYADTKKAEAISAAASDATTKADTAQSNAQSYADTKKAEAIAAAAADATSKANSAQAGAQSYADSKKQEAIDAAASDATTKANTAQSGAQAFATSADTAILASANSYADTKKAEAIDAAASDATTKATNAQTAAQSYASTADTTILSSAQSYAETKKTEAIASAQSYTDSKISILASKMVQEAYTVNTIAERNALTIGDAVGEVSPGDVVKVLNYDGQGTIGYYSYETGLGYILIKTGASDPIDTMKAYAIAMTLW